MSTTYESCALQFPSSYVLMDAAEMEYLEGGGIGKHWYNKTSTVGVALDAIFIIASAGASIYSTASLRAFIRANRKSLIKTVQGELLKQIGTVTATTVGAAIDLTLTLAGTSFGGLIALGLDYVDGKRNDGYVFA